MQFKRTNRRDVDVNITPLIDVVFLLLIFFMVSTTFTDKTELVLELPEATGQAQLQRTESIEILVTRAGSFTINNQALINQDVESLKSGMSRLAQGSTDLPVIITADAMSPHQAVVKVMDAAGQLGFKKLSMTTLEPAGD